MDFCCSRSSSPHTIDLCPQCCLVCRYTLYYLEVLTTYLSAFIHACLMVCDPRFPISIQLVDVVLAVMVEGIAPFRSQSLSPLRTSPWTSRGGLANNECSLMCEMHLKFTGIHPCLEERFHQFKNHTIEVASGYIYSLYSLHRCFFLYLSMFNMFCLLS